MSRIEVAKNIEKIARKLSIGYTDGEIMHELGIKERTYYEYKQRVTKLFVAASERKTIDSIDFEAQLLKDRLTRLYRRLEQRIAQDGEELGEVAQASEIAAMIAMNLLKLESEGLRIRQSRELRNLEIKAGRYTQNIPEHRELSDNAGMADPISTGAADITRKETDRLS